MLFGMVEMDLFWFLIAENWFVYVVEHYETDSDFDHENYNQVFDTVPGYYYKLTAFVNLFKDVFLCSCGFYLFVSAS